LREAEPISIGNFSSKRIERMVDDFLAKNPGPHFTSEIAEALGLDFRTSLETVKRMIDEGKIRRASGAR